MTSLELHRVGFDLCTTVFGVDMRELTLSIKADETWVFRCSLHIYQQQHKQLEKNTSAKQRKKSYQLVVQFTSTLYSKTHTHTQIQSIIFNVM